MDTLFNDFKIAFRQRDNGLNQIILANVILFLLYQVVNFVGFLSQQPFALVVSDYLMLPANLHTLLFKPYTLLTYFFFHKGLFHILFNMLFLYWFGKLIMEYLGNQRLWNLYLLGGFFSGFVYLLAYNIFPVFRNAIGANTYLLGASGAVYAVIFGAATLIPNHTFNLLLIGPVKIVYIATFYLILSFVQVADANSGNPGGNLAHLGGALFGFVYIKQLQRGTDLGKPVAYLMKWLTNLFSSDTVKITRGNTRAYQPQNTGRSGNAYKSETSNNIVNEDELDQLLDKINRSGYDSLSKSEKQKLFKFGQKD